MVSELTIDIEQLVLVVRSANVILTSLHAGIEQTPGPVLKHKK